MIVDAINCCGLVTPLARSKARLKLGYHTVPNLPHKGPGRNPKSQKCSNYKAPRAGSEGRGEELLREHLEPASKVALL